MSLYYYVKNLELTLFCTQHDSVMYLTKKCIILKKTKKNDVSAFNYSIMMGDLKIIKC
jgi:hypothetical protein